MISKVHASVQLVSSPLFTDMFYIKFWNVKLCPTPKSTSQTDQVDDPSSADQEPAYVKQEATETPASLRAKQKAMEEQVYRIWTILSTFEESSAACISEMLRHVSGGMYLDGVGMAEKFVLHVETLFAAIDELGASFRAANAKGA
jgi:hypothetical protein